MIGAIIYYYTRRSVSNAEVFIPDSTPKNNDDSDVFEVVDLPGRGKGLLAKRNIEVFRVLMKCEWKWLIIKLARRAYYQRKTTLCGP